MEVGGRRLQRWMIEAWVEQVAPAAPQRGVDPGILAVGRLHPRRAALPGRAPGERRRTRIDDARLDLRAGLERRGERDAELSFGVGIGRRRDLLAVEVDLGNRELGEEIENQRFDRRLGPQAQRRHALDPLVVREHLQRQIEMIEDQRQLLGRHRAAHLARLGGQILGIIGVVDGRRHLRVRHGTLHEHGRAAHHRRPDRCLAHLVSRHFHDRRSEGTKPPRGSYPAERPADRDFHPGRNHRSGCLPRETGCGVYLKHPNGFPEPCGHSGLQPSPKLL